MPDQDKQEDTTVEKSEEVKKNIAPSVETQGSWIKKAGKLRYGYKKHHHTVDEGLIMGVVATPANVNEITNPEDVLDTTELPTGIAIKTYKGYQSKKNAQILKDRNFKNHIMKKAKLSTPLTSWEVKFNKMIGKTRF